MTKKRVNKVSTLAGKASLKKTIISKRRGSKRKTQKTSRPYTVFGVIYAADGEPAAGLLVQAFNRDVSRAQLIGSANTDSLGAYQIRFSDAQFRRVLDEQDGPEVFIRVTDPVGKLLGQSKTVKGAPPELRLDLTLERELSFGMQGTDIAILHRTITAIGIDIDEAELKEQNFGSTTQEAIRHLQVIAGQTPTGTVDFQMSATLKDALKRLKITPSAQEIAGEYYIEGTVIDVDGMPLAGVNVTAEAHALRTIQEIGCSPTDTSGHYLIRHAVLKSDQQTRLDRGNTFVPDLKLRVFNQQGETLYTSEMQFDVPSGSQIPIALGGPDHSALSEFIRIGQTIAPHLGKLRPDDLAEDEHFRDLSFLAGKTGLAKTRLAFYSVVARLANTTGLAPEFFYGLLSQNIPPNAPVTVLASTRRGVNFDFNTQRILDSILATSEPILLNAIQAAISQNTIPASYAPRVKNDLAALATLRTGAALTATCGMGKTPIKDVLEAAGIPAQKQQKFIELFSARTQPGQDFWQDIANHPELKEEVPTLHFAVNAGRFAKGHMPLVSKLLEMREQGKIKVSSDLARLNVDDWKAILNSPHNGKPIGVPVNFTAEDNESAVDAFAHLLERNFERAYPTTAFSARLAEDQHSPLPNKTAVVAFLDANPKYDLFNTDVDRSLKDNPAAPKGQLEALRDGLNVSKRMVRLASRYPAVKPLLTDGIQSSQQIYAMGRAQFVRKYASHPEIGTADAETIYARAEQTYARALTLAMNLNPNVLTGNPAAIGNMNLIQLQQESKDFPNLQALFGSFNMMECDPARTVLSPAAYLVDSLQFLSKRTANTSGQSVRDVLLARRPDLAQIKLNAANTNTALPYIDLVNELIEEAVAPPDPNHPDPDAPTAIQRQTTLTTPELNANPQYVNKYAYERLGGPMAVFPWTLPFDLPLNEARAYLRQLGIDRVQLMHAFQKRLFIPMYWHVGAPPQQAVDLAVEGLGLSKTEADIITGAAGNQPWRYWGLNQTSNFVTNPVDQKTMVSWTQVLSSVRTLLVRSGLSYETLKQLLNTVFINPQAAIQLYNDPPDSVDLDTMRITGLEQDPGALDRLHCFVRLMRRLDWDVYTLDSAIKGLQPGTNPGKLNSTFLRQLYAVKLAVKRFQTPVATALALWGPIETRTIGDFPTAGSCRYSLYRSLFQNPAIINPVDPIFELSDTGSEVKAAADTNPPMLSDHKPTLLGAFEVSDADLTLAINSFTDGGLTLENLSTLYRHVVLTHGLGISLTELHSYKALFETEQSVAPYEPFDSSRPELLGIFCDAVEKIRSTNFSIHRLDYLLRHKYDSTSGITPDDMAVGTLLKSLLDGLNKIAAENAFSPDPIGAETRRWLTLVLDSSTVDSLMAILSGKSDDDPQDLITTGLGQFMKADIAESTLIGSNALKEGQARYEFVLKGLLAYFRRSQAESLIVQQLANALALPITTTKTLLNRCTTCTYPPQPLIDQFIALLDVVRIPTNSNYPNALSPDEVGKSINGDPVHFKTYFNHYARLDKAAQVINGFGLNSDETDWLCTRGLSQGWLDLTKLPMQEQDNPNRGFLQWSRLADAAVVKKALPSDGTPFTSLMDVASSGADKAAYMAELSKRTQWSMEDLKYLCGADDSSEPDSRSSSANSGLLSLQYPADYCSERALAQLIPAFALLRRLGISANVGAWIAQTITREQADSIKQSVKAKYSSDQWLSIAKALRDPLREQQRDALVAYLLVHPPDGVDSSMDRWYDANDVYAHFLIDVEMSACQATSRIVQANAAIQLFVLRCLLNLESKVTVDNIDTDWQQWRWRSRYRLWEACRKIFLYPENWIEPSLRQDKSSFMSELENDLLQVEVTKESAEDALHSYLEKLDEVARLQVAGVYNDSYVLPVPKTIEVLVSPTEATVLFGGRQQFTASVFNATNQQVNWTASDGGKIHSDGIFRATRSGTFQITATSQQNPTIYGTATVVVPDVSLSLEPMEAKLIIGNTLQFTAAVSNAIDTSIYWESTTPYIDSNGLLTARQVGEFEVTASSVANQYICKKAFITVFGCRPPNNFSASLNIHVQGKFSITVYWGDDNSDTISYEIERNICETSTGFIRIASVLPHNPDNLSEGTNYIDWPSLLYRTGLKIQYRVRAVNKNLDYSDWGETLDVCT